MVAAWAGSIAGAATVNFDALLDSLRLFSAVEIIAFAG